MPRKYTKIKELEPEVFRMVMSSVNFGKKKAAPKPSLFPKFPLIRQGFPLVRLPLNGRTHEIQGKCKIFLVLYIIHQ